MHCQGGRKVGKIIGEEPDWDNPDLMLIITLDRLGQRYKSTPTDILAYATTFDLYVADIAAKWEKRQIDISEGKINPAKDLTQKQMEEMIYKVKKQQGLV
ncbi:hypothetical protein UFOVP635_25 [uncultured Caudovirales phage]|uniref:Uncharacterized protein n=1 Tax=uncultured Caudovirales phage TaxID=2100421 RepID=A0A6J5N5Q7_9CAUD|nr:hypothetical protein UFOVP635_25 [uncultured Caudovirales phage]